MPPNDYSHLIKSPNLVWIETPLPPAMLQLARLDADAVALLGAFQHATRGLRVLASVDKFPGTSAGEWLHLSVSYADQLPTWSDLVHTRDTLVGNDRLFVQLLPPEKYYLNVNPYVLHLFSRLDHETVPSQLYVQQGVTGANYSQGEPR